MPSSARPAPSGGQRAPLNIMITEDLGIRFLMLYVVTPPVVSALVGTMYWSEYRHCPAWQAVTLGACVGFVATGVSIGVWRTGALDVLYRIVEFESLVFHVALPVTMTALAAVATWFLCVQVHRNGQG